MSCRCQMTQVRGLLTDTICKINLKIHSDLMGDRRKMQHTVGGAAQRHIYCQCVEDGIFCHNIAWSDVFSNQFHHLHARMFCKLQPCRIYSRDRAVAAKSHSQRFRQAVHAVCSVHAGTGTAGRTCLILIFTQILIRDLSCRMRSYCFEHTGKTCTSALHMTG